MSEPIKLKKTLGPLMLWGLGVGYVISAMSFRGCTSAGTSVYLPVEPMALLLPGF